MPINGSLEEASLPDVLQLLSLGKKTGCLSLAAGSLRGHVYLDSGRVCYATVVNRRDRVGDSLVKGGRITREQLQQAVEQQARDSQKHVTQILVESGQIDRAELDRFLRVQVEEAVYFLFTWKTGSFTFRSKVQPKDQDFLVSIDPGGLLLEGARRVDEWSVIQKRIPSMDMVFRLEKDPRQDGADLTEEQKRILPHLDGSSDVNALVDATGMVEFDVGKALFGLISAGFAKLVERRARMRHLDLRQTLAYLVHEAEFADPKRRKSAAAHIADCSRCAQRLKTIHIRRTQETRADAVVAGPDETNGQFSAADVTPEVPAPEPVGPRASAGTSEPLGTERRSGSERRFVERRSAERRRAGGNDWPTRSERRTGWDRRHGAQRVAERRAPAMAARRGQAGVARRSAAAASHAASRRTDPRRQRVTGPRRHTPGGGPEPAVEAAPPEPVTAAKPAARPVEEKEPDSQPAEVTASAPTVEVEQRVSPAETPPLAEVSEAPAPSLEATIEAPAIETAPAATVASPDVAAPEVPESPVNQEVTIPDLEMDPEQATPEANPPELDAGSGEGKSSDIEWLVTPRESIEMLRASRAKAAPPHPSPGPPDAANSGSGDKAGRPVAAAPKAAAEKSKQPIGKQSKRGAKKSKREAPRQKRPPETERPAAGQAAKPDQPEGDSSLEATIETVAPTPLAVSPPPLPPPPRHSAPLELGPLGIEVDQPIRKTAARKDREKWEQREPDRAVPAVSRSTAQQSKPRAARARPARWLAIAAAVVVAAGLGWTGSVLFGSGGGEPEPLATPPQQTDAGTEPTTIAAATPGIPTPGLSTEPEPDAPTTRPVIAEPARPDSAGLVQQPPRQVAAPAPVPPAPVVLTGTVLEAETNRPLAGVNIIIAGTGLAVTSGPDGTYRFTQPPVGDLEVIASLTGYQDQRGATRVAPDGGGRLDLRLRPTPPPAPQPVAVTVDSSPPPAEPPAREEPPARVEPPTEPRRQPRVETDPEILDGSWVRIDREEAEDVLGRVIVAVPDLEIESVAKPGGPGRSGIRVVQLLESGERIELVITRPAFLSRGARRADNERVTAVRVAEPTSPGDPATGTGRLGSYLITAKALVTADAMTAMLARLAEPPL